MDVWLAFLIDIKARLAHDIYFVFSRDVSESNKVSKYSICYDLSFVDGSAFVLLAVTKYAQETCVIIFSTREKSQYRKQRQEAQW